MLKNGAGEDSREKGFGYDCKGNLGTLWFVSEVRDEKEGSRRNRDEKQVKSFQ